MYRLIYIQDDTPLRPRMKVNSVNRRQANISITYDACPESPYDLGVMIRNWKLMACDKEKIRTPRSDANLINPFSYHRKHQNCKGRVIFVKIDLIKSHFANNNFSLGEFIYNVYRMISIIGAMSSVTDCPPSIIHSNPNFSMT